MCFLITGGLVLIINSSDMCHQKKRKEHNLKVGADNCHAWEADLSYCSDALLLSMIEN